ncbi:hypothetical protein FA13DRAFT_1067818 [Coprinellus micaceus]|uniref:Uncharacterized protein n=1 Tax=Coprinellus micaceus TaxID=71717 RepID=A0A4Y7TSK3_COPMI|nr:hypothetical protein FA13DRAFT_1067818 [Coprinellus micaceus]
MCRRRSAFFLLASFLHAQSPLSLCPLRLALLLQTRDSSSTLGGGGGALCPSCFSAWECGSPRIASKTHTIRINNVQIPSIRGANVIQHPQEQGTNGINYIQFIQPWQDERRSIITGNTIGGCVRTESTVREHSCRKQPRTSRTTTTAIATIPTRS